MKHGRYSSQKESERIRTEACRCAALVLAGRPERSYTPDAWSLSVFFESYIAKGSAGTMKDFGPKKPTKFKVVGS